MQISSFNTHRPCVFACRTAALALFACSATAGLQAQQTAPVLVASASGPALFSAASTPLATGDIGYSSSAGAEETAAAENFIPSTSAETQPPPRRGYGRPRYADNSHNPDGSSKYTFEAGAGITLPIGNTLKYDTDSYAYQVGFGRNFSKKFSFLVQFDWDNFGLQGANLNSQSKLYFGTTGQGLDGNAHIWSFTLNPVYNFYQTDTLGAYVVGGVGYYHKVTSFTIPVTGTYCDYYYGCYQYQANGLFDHYTSNAPGFNGGIGLTYKFSRFANERFFIEARYIFVDNQQKIGLRQTSSAATAAAYTGNDFYPANSNRTGYIPVKAGIRF